MEEKKLRIFSPNKIYTVVDADKLYGRKNLKGYFADTLRDLHSEFHDKHIRPLEEIDDATQQYRFKTGYDAYSLFYIEEED